MLDTAATPRRLLMGAAAFSLFAWPACAADAPGAATGVMVQGLIVTAERREERLEQVPLSLTALPADVLRLKRIDGAQSLFQATPNVTFSRSQLGGYNLSIRGVGSKFIGASGEYGVSIHENATPISFSRIADAEFFDVDRVEVLRGPQGTLYGRNATGGAINIITARPTWDPGGWATVDRSNYDGWRLSGALNAPLNPMMSVRWAGYALSRDGFGTNSVTGNSVDGREIQASRLSFRLHPNDAVDVNLMWEHFNEKDDRSRTGKLLCISDPGPATLGAVPVSPLNRGFLSQGCLPGSRYQAAAYGAVNTRATLTGLLLPVIGMGQGDLLAGAAQNTNLHDIESVRDPVYEARANFFQIDAQAKLTPQLTLQSLTGFNYDRGYSLQDYLRVAPQQAFSPTDAAAQLFPGGAVNDPQVGASNTLRAFDYPSTRSREFSQELRLYSGFGGAWDFSLGALHSQYRTSNDYYIFSNGLTAVAQVQDAAAGSPGLFPIYVDPGFPPNGDGHNYFVNHSSGSTTSDALFGEVYWRPAASLRVTGGLRLTRDHKQSRPAAVTLLAPATQAAAPPGSGQATNPAFNGGRGAPPAPELSQTFTAVTGRLNVAWTPALSFTDQTLVYARYSRGYKAGGFNTPCDLQSPGCGAVPRTYAPEYVNLYEVGTRNTLAGGRLALNLTGFYSDYTGYQIASTLNKAAVNQNVDAEIYGLELESVWRPTRSLQFDLSAGWLHTAIKGGAIIDPLDRTQGDPGLAVVKATDASNCVVNRAALANLVAIQQGLPGAPNAPGVTGAPGALLGACSGLYSALGLYNYAGRNVVTAPIAVDNAPAPNTIVQVGQGVPVSLQGKQLPEAPAWTLGVGAQYDWELAAWSLTLRGDYYRHGDSYARIFNTVGDKLEGFENVNATLTLRHASWNGDLQLYVKNLTDAQPITSLYLVDDSSGLFTNSFTLEPRVFGVAVTQRF